ncbi:MAG: hypothetical protein R2939_09135 [Kofleriaceae bacterium]
MSPDVEERPLLDAPAFAIAMDRLRLAGYDHIVVDTPPVLGGAEVNLIQDAVDGVVLALRARTSTARDLRRAVEQLSPVWARYRLSPARVARRRDQRPATDLVRT